MRSEPLSIPDDQAACRALMLEFAKRIEAQQRRFDEQQRRLDEQQRVLAETEASYESLRQERDALRDEIAMYRRWIYGPRRERIVEGAGQRHLFELTVETSEVPAAQAEEQPSQDRTPRRSRRRTRQLDLDRLPQRRIEHDLAPEEKCCGGCGCEMGRIGTDESRVLMYRPAVLEVEVHVRPKYACSKCKSGVASPPVPERVIERSIAGPGLISHIVVSKYSDHLPLYRQEDILARHGLYIPRSTLCDWLRGASDLLWPLYSWMRERVLRSSVIWTDDTPVRLIDRAAEGGSRRARFWTYIGDEAHPYSVYDFTTDWARAGPQQFLSGYHGYLQADAYGGYDGIALDSDGQIVRVACGAHLRRKFVDAQSSAPRPAAQLIEWFRQLYDIEDRAREFAAVDRALLRQAEAVPVLARMRAYLDELSASALPKSALGKAVTYARNQWEAFSRYATDGRLTIDNNVSERTLRAQAIGRKNWLFVGAAEAGPRASVFYSILAGAKRHRLEPWAYLTDVLLHLTAEDPDLNPLLPDHWAAAHPEHVLTHRLEESRRKRSRQQARRAARRRP